MLGLELEYVLCVSLLSKYLSDNLSIVRYVSDYATSFQRYQMTIRKQEMYQEGDPLIDELLHDLATWPIESLGKTILHSGSQFNYRIIPSVLYINIQ